MRIFWRVYRPLAQPMTAAFTIIAFLQNWNNFLFPLVVTNSEKLMMISPGLTIFDGQISKVSYNLMMAGSTHRGGAGAGGGPDRPGRVVGRPHPGRGPLTCGR